MAHLQLALVRFTECSDQCGSDYRGSTVINIVQYNEVPVAFSKLIFPVRNDIRVKDCS